MITQETKVPLTPNQMIILLQIYRGLKNEQFIITEESYVKDIRHLLKTGLIVYDGVHALTAKGTLRVADVLE